MKSPIALFFFGLSLRGSIAFVGKRAARTDRIARYIQAYVVQTKRSETTSAESGFLAAEELVFDDQPETPQDFAYDGRPGNLVEPKGKAFPLQTPHSGRHFLPSHPSYRRPFWKSLLSGQKRNGRFTEGWYYRLTLPEEGVSFAIIISIEDPGCRPSSDLRLVCVQVIGPNDEYLVQVDRDDTLFWAWDKQQGLGCNFRYKSQYDTPDVKATTTALAPAEWKAKVASGFQILPTQFLGRIRGRDGTKGGLTNEGALQVNEKCDFDFSIDPVCGWGDADSIDQKSTAGWLASFSVFEPHWQVTLADARATGRISWKNKTYSFVNAPFYAEKNWGAALPSKWYWTQCNAFDGYEQLSVTAGGGIRKIPFGRREALGMVSVHYNGKFYEAVPWSGAMNWKVDTWGSWALKGNCTYGERPFAVEITYECDPVETPGLVFRAPTQDEGMVRFCRDTFEAKTTLSLWLLEWNNQTKVFERKTGPPLIDQATSVQGGAEVGGGPWWDEWKSDSRVTQPIRALLQIPYRLQHAQQRIRRALKSRFK
jgi:tocopherol cyclase